MKHKDKKGCSVKPMNTDATLKKIKYPGAKDLTSPSAKDNYYDLKENVDSSAKQRIADNGTTQIMKKGKY